MEAKQQEDSIYNSHHGIAMTKQMVKAFRIMKCYATNRIWFECATCGATSVVSKSLALTIKRARKHIKQCKKREAISKRPKGFSFTGWIITYT